jgi:hypothetical protein
VELFFPFPSLALGAALRKGEIYCKSSIITNSVWAKTMGPPPGCLLSHLMGCLKISVSHYFLHSVEPKAAAVALGFTQIRAHVRRTQGRHNSTAREFTIHCWGLYGPQNKPASVFIFKCFLMRKKFKWETSVLKSEVPTERERARGILLFEMLISWWRQNWAL